MRSALLLLLVVLPSLAYYQWERCDREPLSSGLLKSGGPTSTFALAFAFSNAVGLRRHQRQPVSFGSRPFKTRLLQGDSLGFGSRFSRRQCLKSSLQTAAHGLGLTTSQDSTRLVHRTRQSLLQATPSQQRTYDNNMNDGLDDSTTKAKTAGRLWTRAFYTHVDIDDTASVISGLSFNISYHHVPASPGYEHVPPLLLIHPVGIGLASWFWDRLFSSRINEESSSSEGDGATGSSRSQGTRGHPALYAVNLLGCGATTEQNAAIEWKNVVATVTMSTTSELGADVTSRRNVEPERLPSIWVQQCETLLQSIILASSSPFDNSNSLSGAIVVAQGGLAPIAIQLASRNPQTVQSVILTSPPTWSELTTAVPKSSVDRNFDFLSGPLGAVAFGLLETRWAVRFFSDLFLFGSDHTPCDSVWLDQALHEAGPAVRAPVQVFNAGYCQLYSCERALRNLEQPTLILQGQDDVRGNNRRADFAYYMRHCQVVDIPGKNVLPWESPSETAAAIDAFLQQRVAQESSASP